MNSELMRWLLDVDVIPAGAENVELVWERPWPAWLWIGFIVLAAAYAAWSYSRLDGRRSGRALLAGARSAVILLVLLVISGPMLELPRETIEQDWVVVLADRSASMTIPDAGLDRAARITRDEQLRRLVSERDDVWRQLDDEREVVWMGFHAGAFNLDVAPGTSSSAEAWSVDLGEAEGRRTNLNTALSQALQRAAGRPLAGIVVLSDGRTEFPPDGALLRRLRADAVPVFAVPLGSDEPIGDLAVRRVDVPRRAFVRDKVPVVVELDRLGSAGARLSGTVRLIDETTGEELDAVALNGAGDEGDPDRVTLTAEPQFAGEASWRVVVETDRGDLLPDNNAKSFGIELIDRPLRVLFVDGYPRWEYRYLKNLLIREESIDSSIMLLSADRDFAQEGNQPITRLPRSPEEFAEFDVIILGDVPGSFFSADQLEMMRDQVGGRGAGLLWVGGARYTPQSYGGRALADLLPMRGSLDLPRLAEPVNMRPTPLAERLGVLQLATVSAIGWPRELTDSAYTWSRLHYAQRIEPGRLKPAAEVLAETVQAVDGSTYPLVVHMRYGSGQSIYVATDEIWRWRYGRGELLPEQFWLQLIRMLGRESLSQAGAAAVLTVSPRRAQTGQPLRIALRIVDAQLAGAQRGTIRAVVEREEDGRVVAELELRPVSGAEAEFAATYLPDTPGRLRVRIDDRSLAGLDLDAAAEVFSPDDELRRPETDHPLLASVAEATDGQVLNVETISELTELLPRRSVRTLNPLSERIWDTPLAFGLILLTLTAEWIGRKVLRLA